MAEQIERAEVVAECSCGCPSSGLQADAPELAREDFTHLDESINDDLLEIGAWAPSETGSEVEVILHVLAGRVQELEVWAGT